MYNGGFRDGYRPWNVILFKEGVSVDARCCVREESKMNVSAYAVS